MIDSERAAVQRRTIRVLVAAQVIGGVGVAIGFAVGALLAAEMGGTAISGLGQSALVVGTALLAVPVTRLTRARGRRPGLAAAFGFGAAGAATIVLAAQWDSIPLLFVGFLLFGGGSVANLQSRYAAVDLAEPARAGRNLSTVVWATTVGAVAGPNLAPAADAAVGRLDLARYSGPFVVSVLAFAFGAAVVLSLLRPDPLLLSGTAGEAARTGFRPAWRLVRASPGARLGLVAMAVGHLVMVGVMAMTPVHIGQSGHGDVLRVVGLVLSLHVAGMYALSPVAGRLTDRYGPRAVILGGVGLLLAACATAGTAGHDTVHLAVGLTLLGLGWSATMVAGSTLFSRSVEPGARPSAQGLADIVMGLAGAAAGAAGGVIVAWSGYGTLALLAAVATVPLLAMALRPDGAGAGLDGAGSDGAGSDGAGSGGAGSGGAGSGGSGSAPVAAGSSEGS